MEVFTDASFDPKSKTGSWAAIILHKGKEELLSEVLQDISQHGMELFSILQCLKYIENNYSAAEKIRVYTDSEYVENLPLRRNKLEKSGFLSKKGKRIAHTKLIQNFFRLMDSLPVELVRVSGHQKSGVSKITDYNRRVDKFSRKILREKIRNR
ncbi:MAG: RNase H family protein [Bacteroidales bacterium]